MDITLVVGQLVEFDIWGGKVKYGWVHLVAQDGMVMIRTKPKPDALNPNEIGTDGNHTYNTIPRAKVRPVDNPLTIERWLAHE